MSILVKLHGRTLWFLGEDLDDYLEHALAPVEHCDSKGNINGKTALALYMNSAYLMVLGPAKLGAMRTDSYGYVDCNGVIWRYGRTIGRVDDLEVLQSANAKQPEPVETAQKSANKEV